ncbi:hypothetical protein EK904_004782 [Melospiza melodia maxima]|nr:hypothetical protein EK904_004782 [Melospiza melodia maxima]
MVMMMKVSNSSRMRLKVKSSWRLFHDKHDGGQGQVTNPDEGQQLFQDESEGQKLLEALP